MQKPELLAPGGSLSKLKTAIDYGADAVYVGGEAFSLRVAAENFTIEELKQGLEYAHIRDKKVYLTANILPHNRDLEDFSGYLDEISPLGFDGILVSDPGMFELVKSKCPHIPIHISTQANNVNYGSAQFWKKMGASRVVLAREMSFEEISVIREKNPDLELEAFIHGAMCISYSGRCLLSNYMTGRDSNKGACAHPCRWNYSLVEQTRPGEYFDIYENDRGSFIFNSKDLCMIEYIPQLVKSGITSFKLEGRVKTEYYVATVVGAYRREIDKYFQDPENYKFDGKELHELMKVSHRPYITGFYFGRPEGKAQVYGSNSYIRHYDLIGIVTDYDIHTGIMTISQRNRFFAGEEVEIISPGKPYFKQIIGEMFNDKDELITVAPHAAMTVKMKSDQPVVVGSMLRRGEIPEEGDGEE